MPNIPKGSVPKPFIRPAVTIGGSPVEREWRHVPLSSVSKGDIVADYGQIEHASDGQYVVLTFLNGKTLSTQDTQSVFAFVPKAS